MFQRFDLTLGVFALLANISKDTLNLALKQVQVLLIEEHLSVGEPGLDPLLKIVHHVDFHASRHEHELDLAVLQHIQNLIQKNLLRLRYIKVNVFEHKQKRNARIPLKILLNLWDHLHGVELLGLCL